MAFFAVMMTHGPGWDPSRPVRKQDAWEQHADFMDGLVDDRFVILGGPVGDLSGPTGGDGALQLVEAADESEVRARLSQDPWAAMGVLQVSTVQPWALWLDGTRGLLTR